MTVNQAELNFRTRGIFPLHGGLGARPLTLTVATTSALFSFP